ncbi:hypothetical protein AK812_SmicGene4692 [Symbiodinium microadriaticum]|uniref:Uncharacterized protein n=1 Tax=Symbiodinium microadriaticum TaxID=2951 RepID=A0A1Q9EVV4_SYMMI|nr:hypothetical protein AK812_SmicGene4692 [Symbiodinium microadriaticum]
MSKLAGSGLAKFASIYCQQLPAERQRDVALHQCQVVDREFGKPPRQKESTETPPEDFQDEKSRSSQGSNVETPRKETSKEIGAWAPGQPRQGSEIPASVSRVWATTYADCEIVSSGRSQCDAGSHAREQHDDIDPKLIASVNRDACEDMIVFVAECLEPLLFDTAPLALKGVRAFQLAGALVDQDRHRVEEEGHRLLGHHPIMRPMVRWARAYSQ